MSSSIEVKIFANPKKVVKALSKEIYAITHEAQQERYDIALSGGKTPSRFFELLAKKICGQTALG